MSQERGQEFLGELPRIRSDLPFSPELLRQLFVQTGPDSGIGMDEVARTVEKDQGMTAKILALANSAFYGLQGQVGTVSRAVTLLGLKELRALIIALGVRYLARSRPLPDSLNLSAYWLHQVRVATLCRALAPLVRGQDPDTLFTAGLLHDLGKLVMALHRPEDWEAVLALVRAQKLSFRDAEEIHWGLDHALVGSLALKAWDLPSELAEPVSWHHSPELAPEYKTQALVLALADCLVHRAEEPSAPEARSFSSLAAALGLDEQAVVDLAAQTLDHAGVEQFAAALL